MPVRGQCVVDIDSPWERASMLPLSTCLAIVGTISLVVLSVLCPRSASSCDPHLPGRKLAFIFCRLPWGVVMDTPSFVFSSRWPPCLFRTYRRKRTHPKTHCAPRGKLLARTLTAHRWCGVCPLTDTLRRPCERVREKTQREGVRKLQQRRQRCRHRLAA